LCGLEEEKQQNEPLQASLWSSSDV
jgi:hypothetical protein